MRFLVIVTVAVEGVGDELEARDAVMDALADGSTTSDLDVRTIDAVEAD